jgi:hypothetical protein
MLENRSSAMLWSESRRRKVYAIVQTLQGVIEFVENSLPFTKSLLKRIIYGLDCANTSYRGFYNPRTGIIVINMAAFLLRLPSSHGVVEEEDPEYASSCYRPPTMLRHSLLTTVAHELAHLLNDDEGNVFDDHGLKWRILFTSLINELTVSTCALFVDPEDDEPPGSGVTGGGNRTAPSEGPMHSLSLPGGHWAKQKFCGCGNSHV